MDMNLLPLISVPVVTYNSSKTVLETLDSIYNQTYENLELIVSDDCSTDNTVDICQEWINAHKERFVRTELLVVEKNTGVSANMNRAEAACQGEWVKPIAGDDVLLPKCVEIYVDYVKNHPEAVCVFGKVEAFGDNKEIVDRFQDTIFDYSFFALPIVEQYKWLITRSFQPIPAATTFYNYHKTREIGVIYDERIPMLEDWPRWIRCLEKGVRFHFVDKTVVRYRVSDNSICSGTLYIEKFQKSLALMYIYYQYEPAIKFKGFWLATLKYIHCKYVITGSFLWHVADFAIRRVSRLFRKQDEFY
jgi:alpha-1,3-rhamnosyltransferase